MQTPKVSNIDERDSIKSWIQGFFVDQKQYNHWTNEEKNNAKLEEKHRVRPSPLGNAICRCSNPDDARWIANRLNLASTLEYLIMNGAHDTVDGKTVAIRLRGIINSYKEER